MKSHWFVTFALLVGVVSGQRSQGLLDAARITSGEFRPERFGPARWLDGAHFATLEPSTVGDGLDLVRYEAVSGGREVLVSAAMLRVPSEQRTLRIEGYTFSPDGSWLMVFTDSERVWRENTRGAFYVLPLDGSAPPRRLGGAQPRSSLQFAKFSPDGGRVAYVSENDLFVESVASGEQAQLTDDGSKTVINGTFDWVYEEEFDCRDGFRWSPDGQRLAYWQLDCSGVGEFYMVDNLSDRYAQIVPVQYPKAGTTNSSCRVGVISAAGGETVWMKTPGDPRENYVPRMEWHPLGEELMVQWLPRAQNHLIVFGCDAATGSVRKVHEERDAAYVDVREDFRWTKGGEAFFWTSDVAFQEEGDEAWRQAGTISWRNDGIVKQLTWTSGYDVISVDHVDLEAGEVMVSGHGSDGAMTGHSLFLDGSGKQRAGLTPVEQHGWHDYQISADGSLAIHTYSAFDQPPVIDLVRLPSHERVRVLVDNQRLRARYAEVEKGESEFFQVATKDGHALDGWVMYPAGFDPEKKWPVLFHVYGEPWGQTVKDTWSLGHHLFHRWVSQQGYVVMSVDARGTPAPKGRDWRKALYQNIGVVSSHDWSQAVPALLAQHGWMDRERMAIWGWSGGGAMTLNMLFRYPELFCAGMSVAPVTHISLYDTIYQERYCGDPREVPEVYERCSPVNFAHQLQGDLLLVHGTADDNVHFQNSERLFDALVAHGKLFEYLAYPNRSHSIYERKGTRAHLYGSLADFLRRRVASGPR